jgi:hypothetical protein
MRAARAEDRGAARRTEEGAVGRVHSGGKPAISDAEYARRICEALRGGDSVMSAKDLFRRVKAQPTRLYTVLRGMIERGEVVRLGPVRGPGIRFALPGQAEVCTEAVDAPSAPVADASRPEAPRPAEVAPVARNLAGILPQVQEAVIAALRREGHPLMRAVIQARVGYPMSSVIVALDGLRAAKRVRLAADGGWRLLA